MKVSIWDTYVTRKNGTIMHFDIIVPNEMANKNSIFEYGNIYLRTKCEDSQPITTKECTYCHMEEAKAEWKEGIIKQGFYIYEIENCK